MKHLTVLFLSLMSFFSFSQEVNGTWFGILDVMGKEMPFGLQIEKDSAKIFNPESKSMSFDIDSVALNNSQLNFFVTKLGLHYTGTCENDSIKGFWTQAGQSFPLLFTRKEVTAKALKRPQTPVAPFDYYTEEITVQNEKANLGLAGTLALPTNDGKKYPLVLLISGSGPQDRDSEIIEHRSFAVIADHLAKQGIGSFRYDERGVGKSSGKYYGSDLSDLQSDVEVVVKMLLERKEIAKLGILGHSEGGIIGPKYASENRKEIDFVILMGAPGVAVNELMHKQRRTNYEFSGMTEKAILANKIMFTKIDEAVLSAKNEEEKGKLVAEIVSQKMKKELVIEEVSKATQDAILKFIDGPWYKSFIEIVPSTYLKKLKCPVLAMGGGKDVQVDSKDNLSAISAALNSKRFCKVDQTIKLFDDLNHLMQPAVTGNVDEYGTIETTIDRQVLFQISEWIKELK